MIIVIVDTERESLKRSVKILKNIYRHSQIVMFSDPLAASEYFEYNPIDLLYSEINMAKLSGFALQTKLRIVQPSVPVIFMADTDQYARKAIQTRAEGYIVKPVTTAKIEEFAKEEMI